MAGKVVDVTLRLIDKMSSPLNSLGGKLAQSANQWTKAGKQIQTAGKGIAKVGSTMTASLTTPIVGAGVACVKLASDFEAGMSKVQSIAGATGEEMDMLSKKAKEMGAKTKYSATEATDAFSYMAMAGWDVQQMTDGIEGIMYLAGATGEDLAQTSDIVTDALTAFGLQASDTERFVNVLAQTANRSNTDVSLLGESFQYVAPVAGALKYSIEDTSVALGLMANSGIKASQAGTSLRSWITRMASPTKQSSEAMDKLGLSLIDSQGKTKDFNTVMEETRKAFSGLTEAEKTQYASLLAGKTGMAGLLAVVNSAEGDFQKLSDAIYDSNGACKEMYDVANDNLQGQLTILKSTVESIAISFGERMTPYVKALTEHLQNLADKFNSLTTAQQDTIIKILGVVACIGPAVLIFGKLVTGIGSVVMAVGKIGKAFRTFGSIAGLLTSPVGIVIGVLLAVGVAVYALIKNWDKIKPVFQRTAKLLQPAKDALIGLMNTVKKTVSPIVKLFKGEMSKAIDDSMGIVKKAFGGAGDPLKKFTGMVNSGVKKVCAVLGDLVKTIAPTVKSFISGFAKQIPKAVKLVVDVMKILLPAVKKVGDIIVKFLSGALKDTIPVIKKIVPIVKSLAKTIGDVLGKAIKRMLPTIQSLLKKFTSVFGNIAKSASKFYSKLAPVIGEVISVLGKIAGFVVKILGPAFTVAFDAVAGVVRNAFDTIGNVATGIFKIFGGVVDFITGVFTGNWKKAWEGVKSIFSGIFDTFTTIVKAPLNAIIGLVNGAIKGFNKLKIPEWVPKVGGKGINIPLIPQLAKGTDNWKGGIVQISEKGGEIVDLPSGSRVYPHDESVQKAYHDGAKSKGGGNTITITIPKLADQISVRSDGDIDKIAQTIADKLEKVSKNLGGGEIGYLY